MNFIVEIQIEFALKMFNFRNSVPCLLEASVIWKILSVCSTNMCENLNFDQSSTNYQQREMFSKNKLLIINY